jgi:hypothetical protein
VSKTTVRLRGRQVDRPGAAPVDFADRISKVEVLVDFERQKETRT